jgi:hypothetical protein
MCSAQLEAPSQRSNDSSVYPHNKNDKPWLLWRRPCDKRSEPRLLGCSKVTQPSAIALTRSARWNQISALRRDQLYRRSSKIQFALSWRVGASSFSFGRARQSFEIFRRGLTIHRSAWSIILTSCSMILSQASSSRANVSAEIYR